MEEDDGDGVEAAAELDGFKDFTVSSSWERLIASVESICQEWHSAGRFKLLKESNAKVVKGLRGMHHISTDVSQGHKNYRLELFVSDQHGNTRANGLQDWQFGLHHLQTLFGVEDFIVIAPVSLSGVLLDAPEATMLLSTVSIALSNCGSTWPVFVPVHIPTRKAFMGIESLQNGSIKYEADKLGGQVPIKLMHLEGLYDLFTSKLGSTSDNIPRLGFTMKLTYATTHDLFRSGASSTGEQGEELNTEAAESVLWDDDFPWAEWHSVEDPIKGFQLITTWRNTYISSSIEMAEFENASTFEADTWMLKPLQNRNDDKSDSTGFAGRLRRLVQAFVASKEAEFMEDFVTVTKRNIEDATRSCKVPPTTVLDRVLKDIVFQAPSGSQYTDENARIIKGAPPDSLFGRFCLHTLWFGDCNIRAISDLWVEFIREVHWCWEQLQPLPRSLPDEVPDFATCLIHQKLQLLAKCIKLKKASSTDKKKDTKKKLKRTHEPMEIDGDEVRKGSAGPFGNLYLAKSNKPLHAPITQTPPIMTEDMLQEREQALAALEDSPSGRAARIRLQSDILASDMAAFKAANPDAILEDFIKWHSPRDWIEEGSSSNAGRLSKRMTEPGNAWLQIWDSKDALQASEQKLIFDYMREGEKVLHYLETLRPHQLLAQIICTAFVASADVLCKIPGVNLEPVVKLFDEFYSVAAAVLLPLASISLSDKEMRENINAWERDISQLCDLFENLENSVALAASLTQKLPQASGPLLNSLFTYAEESAAVLNSYKERDMVADTLFSHQSVSETWEESLRMGNFLNGHEPMLREVLFTCYDKEPVYGESSQRTIARRPSMRRGYSYRMYVCATVDDLQIALSSTSED